MEFLNIWNGSHVDEMAFKQILKSKVNMEPYSLEPNNFTAFLIESSVWNKLAMLHTIAKVYDKDNVNIEKTFDDFMSLNKKTLDKVKGSIRRRDYRKTDKDSVILLCFAFDFTVNECNDALKLLGHDELHSRNLSDGLMIYFLNNKKRTRASTSKLRDINDLYDDFCLYCSLLNKYKGIMSERFGYEIEGSFIKDEEDDAEQISRRLTLRNLMVRGKKQTIGEFIELIENNIKKSTEITSDADAISKTTVYLFSELNKTVDLLSLENLIEKETKLWCTYRNRTFKEIIGILKAIDPKMTFDKFAKEFERFYTYKIKYSFLSFYSNLEDDLKAVDYLQHKTKEEKNNLITGLEHFKHLFRNKIAAFPLGTLDNIKLLLESDAQSDVMKHWGTLELIDIKQFIKITKEFSEQFPTHTLLCSTLSNFLSELKEYKPKVGMNHSYLLLLGEYSTSASFKRRLQKILTGQSPITRSILISFLIFVSYKANLKIDVHLINRYLSTCKYSPLGDSPADTLMRYWIDHYQNLDPKEALNNFLKTIETEIMTGINDIFDSIRTEIVKNFIPKKQGSFFIEPSEVALNSITKKYTDRFEDTLKNSDELITTFFEKYIDDAIKELTNNTSSTQASIHNDLLKFANKKKNAVNDALPSLLSFYNAKHSFIYWN